MWRREGIKKKKKRRERERETSLRRPDPLTDVVVNAVSRLLLLLFPLKSSPASITVACAGRQHVCSLRPHNRFDPTTLHPIPVPDPGPFVVSLLHHPRRCCQQASLPKKTGERREEDDQKKKWGGGGEGGGGKGRAPYGALWSGPKVC